ncbi:MAG: L,D-transpeptidase family protein [Pseudomonadota bacterium]
MRLAYTGIFALMVGASNIGPAFAAQDDPLHIIVSLADQNLKVFRGEELVTQSNISSGKKGHDTPTGIFSVLQKNRHHRSNIYSNAPMPFMQRLTWSGIALHASNSVPDHPASHGCVRMPHSFASELFRMRTRGAHVIIEQEPQAPVRIEHGFLFQPAKTWQASKDYDVWVNTHITNENDGLIAPNEQYASRVLITRRTHKEDIFDTQDLLNELGFDSGDVDGIMGPATWAAIVRFQKANDLEPNGTIDNSLLEALYKKARKIRPANGRVLVRQHHKTIYEAEVSISSPEQPLGSHLLTVTRFDAENSKTDWLHLSLNDRVHRQINLRTGGAIDPTSARQSISDTLARIEMSADVHTQISKLLTPGSSIAISDNGLSIETGAKGTDFIVLTKPETENNQFAAKL